MSASDWMMPAIVMGAILILLLAEGVRQLLVRIHKRTRSWRGSRGLVRCCLPAPQSDCNRFAPDPAKGIRNDFSIYSKYRG